MYRILSSKRPPPFLMILWFIYTMRYAYKRLVCVSAHPCFLAHEFQVPMDAYLREYGMWNHTCMLVLYCTYMYMCGSVKWAGPTMVIAIRYNVIRQQMFLSSWMLFCCLMHSWFLIHIHAHVAGFLSKGTSYLSWYVYVRLKCRLYPWLLDNINDQKLGFSLSSVYHCSCNTLQICKQTLLLFVIFGCHALLCFASLVSVLISWTYHGTSHPVSYPGYFCGCFSTNQIQKLKTGRGIITVVNWVSTHGCLEFSDQTEAICKHMFLAIC